MLPYVTESSLELAPQLHVSTSFNGSKHIPWRDRCFLTAGSSRVPATTRPTQEISSASGDFECPEGFAPHTGTETEHRCVFPCTCFLYTREQLDSQFSAYVATGLIGMVANLSLIAWYSSSFLFEWNQKRRGKKKKGWSTLPTFVFNCAVLGFLFGLIDTIPAALLKFDLPCSGGCIDEFCYGNGLACKVAQPSEYLLLLVFCILLGTLVELYMNVILNSPPPRMSQVKRCYSMGVFVMMLVVVFACMFADSGALATESDEYRQHVVARDVFSCSPRHSSLIQELVFLTLPFMFVCLALVGVTIGMIVNIWKAVMRVRDKSQISRSVKKFGKLAGKLMALVVVVFILWVVRASIAAAQEPIIANFNVDARKWADCLQIKSMTETASQVVSCVRKRFYLPPRLQLHPHLFPSQIYVFDPQLNMEVDDCDAVPNPGTSMWTARVLSIIVKNMQSYIVTVVWGVAEVLSVLKYKGDKYTIHGSKKGTSIKDESLISIASVAPSPGVDN
jgi:hypothetical protein